MKYIALVLFFIYGTQLAAILPDEAMPFVLPDISQLSELEAKITKYEEWKSFWQQRWAESPENAKKFTSVILQLLDVKLRKAFIDSLTQGNQASSHDLVREAMSTFAKLTESASTKNGLTDEVKRKIWNSFLTVNEFAECFATSSDPILLVRLADITKATLRTLVIAGDCA